MSYHFFTALFFVGGITLFSILVIFGFVDILRRIGLWPAELVPPEAPAAAPADSADSGYRAYALKPGFLKYNFKFRPLLMPSVSPASAVACGESDLARELEKSANGDTPAKSANGYASRVSAVDVLGLTRADRASISEEILKGGEEVARLSARCNPLLEAERIKQQNLEDTIRKVLREELHGTHLAPPPTMDPSGVPSGDVPAPPVYSQTMPRSWCQDFTAEDPAPPTVYRFPPEFTPEDIQQAHVYDNQLTRIPDLRSPGALADRRVTPTRRIKAKEVLHARRVLFSIGSGGRRNSKVYDRRRGDKK